MFDVASLKRAIQTLPEGSLCGDQTLVVEKKEYLFFALFDGAGHGPMACNAATRACRYLKEETERDLSVLLDELHELLKGTVGGVGSLCRINKATGVMQYSGIGNAVTRLFLPESKNLVMRDGVLGHEIARPQMSEFVVEPGHVVMLYSDGIRDHFDTAEFPDFFELSASDIARITIDYFSKTLDDASCIVVKVSDD
jgi:phosphoserine phosphatase RsbX